MPDIVVTVPSTDRDAMSAVIDRLPNLLDRRLPLLRAGGSKTERRYEVAGGASQQVAGRRRRVAARPGGADQPAGSPARPPASAASSRSQAVNSARRARGKLHR